MRWKAQFTFEVGDYYVILYKNAGCIGRVTDISGDHIQTQGLHCFGNCGRYSNRPCGNHGICWSDARKLDSATQIERYIEFLELLLF